MQEIERDQRKIEKAIEKFLNFQESPSYHATNTTDRNMTILDYLNDSEISKRENFLNFKTKDEVEKVKSENFKNSVYIGH
mmetsp:Transcript_27854/g.20881  ORF Transcript_27854/g.20881 Transcript_27854/m.20881 type:complete len:80 (+) Transcript_27854:209-448(+)